MGCITSFIVILDIVSDIYNLLQMYSKDQLNYFSFLLAAIIFQWVVNLLFTCFMRKNVKSSFSNKIIDSFFYGVFIIIGQTHIYILLNQN